MIELTPLQVTVLSAVAIAITWGLKLVGVYFGYKPPRPAVTTGLFVISLVATIAWTPATLPPLPPLGDVSGLFAWLTSVLEIASPVLTLAYLVYNFLYSKVFSPATEKVKSLAKKKR